MHFRFLLYTRTHTQIGQEDAASYKNHFLAASISWLKEPARCLVRLTNGKRILLLEQWLNVRAGPENIKMHLSTLCLLVKNCGHEKMCKGIIIDF